MVGYDIDRNEIAFSGNWSERPVLKGSFLRNIRTLESKTVTGLVIIAGFYRASF